MLLNLLKGAIAFTSVAAFIGLSAALIELWVQRNEERDAEYSLVLTVLKWLSVSGWFLCLLLMSNYMYRFWNGLPGSTLPGPEGNTIFALASFVAVYGFLTLVAVVMLYLLWQSDEPTDEERARRDRIAKRRVELELRRRQRREGSRWLRRGA